MTPLDKARALAAAGDDETAKQAYLAILRDDPDQLDALVELGVLAEASGHRSAARSAYQRAVVLDPDHAIARTGLANMLAAENRLTAARNHYRAALRSDPDCAAAHRGLAGVLLALGDDAAEAHLAAGYARQTVIPQRYRGEGPSVPLLMLFSARGGNLDTKPWVDDRRYAVTALCADFHDPEAPLPGHAVIVNAIGDADLCAEALARAERLVAGSAAPVINPPARVAATSRTNNARRLAQIGNVAVPQTEAVPRAALGRLRNGTFPLLLRSPGYHTGQHFRRVDTPGDLAEAAAALPGETLLAIAWHDCRGADGLFRKYRAMFIDGEMLPLHMAASRDWKVHYFTAAMAEDPVLRQEEARFLNDMQASLGPKPMAALRAIGRTLGLDYGGVDFALRPDGSVLVFEANATMVAPPPGPEAIWDYRRPAVSAVLDGAASMLRRRSAIAG